LPFNGDVQHAEDLLEGVPLDGLLAVLEIPHDRLAHAGELGQLSLGQPGFSPMTLNNLAQGDHCCFSSKQPHKSLFSSPKISLWRCIYRLKGKFVLLYRSPLQIYAEYSTFTSKAVTLGVNPLLVWRMCPASLRHSQKTSRRNKLAEREGFEPSVPLRARLISSQVQSTTLPPLRFKNGGT
jgi:hypothetical protein